MPEQNPDPVFNALLSAQGREGFATALDTKGLRELADGVRYNAVFTARGVSVVFADEIKRVIDDITNDRINVQEGMLQLRNKLAALGYTPERGFAGAEGMVPTAEAGSLQDLSSFRRLKLIVDTQVAMMTGRGEQMRFGTPANLASFPALELIRVLPVRDARNWPSRWAIAGGKPPAAFVGGYAYRIVRQPTGMIALYGDPVWGELGASANFSDALDVDHPPFAFNSGMGWRQVPKARAKSLGITGPNGESIEDWFASRPQTMAGATALPAPRLSMRRLDPALARTFSEQTGAVPGPGHTVTVPRKPDGSLDFSDLMAKSIARRNAARKGAR